MLLAAGEGAGLGFDPGVDAPNDGSHKNRIRVLAPRILEAYERLPHQERLLAGQGMLAALRGCGFDMAAVAAGLNAAGWNLCDTGFDVRSPETRELFFPKDSQWDAFVVLRNLLGRARERVVVVDPYCDERIFELLTAPPDGLVVEVLCSGRTSTQVLGARRAFCQQYRRVTVEVRITADFHDRFVVLDGKTCIHVGASINHAGRTAFMVSELADPANREALLRQICESWNDATQAT